MLKATLSALACATLLGLSAASAQAPAGGPPPGAPPPAPITIKPVKPGLYMVTGAGGNVTVRVGSDALIVVDTKNAGQKNFDDLMAQIRTVSDKPVKYVFDTHHHGDHTGNNQRFIDAKAIVVANDQLPQYLKAFTPPANNPAAIAPAQPSETYKGSKTYKVGGASAMAYHYAPAHTGGDTIVYFADLKTIATGDEVVAANPNLDYVGGANVKGWINSLDQVLKLDFDTVIPGHGDNPMTKDQVKAFRDKLATFLSRAKAEVKAGATKDDLAGRIKVDDLGWTFAPNFWTAPGRVEGLLAEASAP